MDHRGVLAAFHEQIRRRPESGPRSVVEADAPVVRVVASGDGWSGVTWSDLADADVDTVIAAQVGRFSVAVHSTDMAFLMPLAGDHQGTQGPTGPTRTLL